MLEWVCSIRLQVLPRRALPELDQLTLVAFCLLGGWLWVPWCVVAIGTFCQKPWFVFFWDLGISVVCIAQAFIIIIPVLWLFQLFLGV